MGWLIALGIILFLLLIGQLWVHVTVEYRDEPQVFIKILWFRFRIVPAKKKEIDLDEYRIGKFRKRRLKDRARQRKKARDKAIKKANKKKKKEEAKKKRLEDEASGKVPKKTLRRTLADLRGKVDFGLDVLKQVALPMIKRFYKSLRIHVYHIHLTIATDDAAKTAQTYGIASASLADLLALFEQTAHLSYDKDASIGVCADYLLCKSVIDAKVRFSLRIRHILSLPFGAAVDFIKLLIQKL